MCEHTNKQTICDVGVCPTCYEQELLAEPIVSVNKPEIDIIDVWSPEKHRMVMKGVPSDQSAKNR